MKQDFKEWSQLIMCSKIKPNEKIVLMVILNCNNMNWPFIAHTEIMKQSGLKETSVKKAIKSLRKMGLITKVKTDTNNMNNYIASGFNLTSLITSGSKSDPLNTTETTSGFNLTPQVGRKTTTSGSQNACNNNIKKKERDIVSNMDYNHSTRRETTEQTNNNMEFKKNGMYMELNSQSAGTTKVVKIEDKEDIQSKLPPIQSSSVSKEKKNIHQITTTEDRKDNTLSNASLHNKNEDNPMDGGEISIDDLEYIFNRGNPIPTQPISKGGSKTTSMAKSKEGGGRKFTPRKEWEIAMRVTLQHINNSSDIHNELTTDDVNILYEGANDKYRVIETIKAIQQMLTYRMKFPTYHHLLNDAINTLEANEETYTPKQFDYACEIYDDCIDRYEKIIKNK